MLDQQDYIHAQVSDHWFMVKDGNASARRLFDRHYSRIHYRDGRQPKLFVGPGEKCVLISPRLGFLNEHHIAADYNPADALFVWRSFVSGDGQESVNGWGLNCAVFRNEGDAQSSLLILEAEEVVRLIWGWHNRAYTYVNASSVTSRNPGYCFKRAGWRRSGRTQRGLHILEKDFWA